MSLATHERTIKSRWDRTPVVRDGKKIVVRLTQRDIEILKLLTHYRYLPSDYIHAFVGGGLQALTKRLHALTCEPNMYIARPVQQRANANANYQRLIYELDSRGVTVLKELGIEADRPRVHNFAHELMVCQIMASIELGVRADPSMRLISWNEILESDKLPRRTRESEHPASIPVSFDLRGEQCRIGVRADGKPFGLQRIVDEKPTYYFFPGIEADCGTEPVSTSDFERSSIYKKFAAYLAIIEQRRGYEHFGFPNLFIPFITTTKAREESMMKLLERLTRGRGSKNILFKTAPAFTSFQPSPAPSGKMLTEPWKRVGYPPLHLNG